MTKNTKSLDKLDSKLINKYLAEKSLQSLVDLNVFDCISSTNDSVMALGRCNKKQYVACIANQQSEGRGRNGNVWQSPANSNIYMSVGCYFKLSQLDGLSGLSLACGVAICRYLQSLDLPVSLKWPNDILLDNKKLAGILIETRIRSDQVFVVIGIGMNVNMSEAAADKIDQSWTDLYKALAPTHGSPERNYLVAQLLAAIIDCCVDYSQSGFESFLDDWYRLDILLGRNVTIKLDNKEIKAKVLGLDDSYGLQVDINNEEKVFYAADIRLKLEENVNN